MMAMSLGSFPSGPSIPMQQTPPGNPKFVNLDPKYLCLECRNVLRDAVQTLCGHRMCECCATNMFDGPLPVRCPGNEDTCVPELKKEEIFRDPSARREIRLLYVYCTFNEYGCKVEMAWKDLEGHGLICEFRLVDCPNKESGCPERKSFKLLSDHVKDCIYRRMACQHCGEMIIFNQKQIHDERDCRQIIVECIYGCGRSPLPRFQMEMHLAECPKKPIFCKFKNVGCEFQGSQEQVFLHQQEATDHHLQLITLFTASMDLRSLEIRRELQEISIGSESLNASITTINGEQRTLKDGIDSLKHGMKDLKLKVVAQTERVIHLERKVEDLARKDLVEKHSRDIQVVKDSLANVTDRVGQVERNAGTGNQGGHEQGGNTQGQLTHHERQIGLQDVRLAELDLRLQIHETASFNGELMWKIRDYARRKQEAMTGRTLSLYSQPFYTSQFGYKMCARVYLNGDGMGKGTHLSLFFVIMRGDFDALLPWPFKQKVTMMLLDQENRNKHLSDSFRPDPTSNSFKKPTTEMNIASGCPLFVSHAVLETRTYLHDDTIYIKVVVDTEGINPP